MANLRLQLPEVMDKILTTPIPCAVNPAARAVSSQPRPGFPEYIAAPAASLVAAYAALRRARRALVSPQAQIEYVRAAIARSLGLAPAPHPKRCSGVLLTLSRRGAPRIASLSSAASAPAARRSSPCRRSSLPASPCRAAPCAALRAPRRSSCVSAFAPGAVSSGFALVRRSSRGFAPAPRDPPPARRRFSPPPCRPAASRHSKPPAAPPPAPATVLNVY